VKRDGHLADGGGDAQNGRRKEEGRPGSSSTAIRAWTISGGRTRLTGTCWETARCPCSWMPNGAITSLGVRG